MPLEKVFLSVGEKQTIELSDMEEITSEVKVSTVFDLTDAIGYQDLEKALGILERAMELEAVFFRKEEEGSKFGDPIPVLLSMMAKQYWSMLVIKQMGSHQGDIGELAKALGTSPWNIKKLIDQGKNFSEAFTQGRNPEVSSGRLSDQEEPGTKRSFDGKVGD